MQIQNLETACKEFLRKYNFVTLTWDGEEVTAFKDNGEPFEQREFNKGTATRRAFEQLELMFERRRMTAYFVSI